MESESFDKRTKHVSQLNPKDLEILRRAIAKGNGDKIATFEALKEELMGNPDISPDLKEKMEKISEQYRHQKEE